MYPPGHRIRTSIVTDWCYDHTHHIEMVQTIRAYSELYESEAPLVLMQNGGWKPGFSEDDPCETIWQCKHDGGLLYVEYNSEVRVKYGNKRQKICGPIYLPSCEFEVYAPPSGHTADWKGNHY